jgi:hypothetical protein
MIFVCRKPAKPQAALARRYGIEGFCYYHYWFAGRRILERPVWEVLHSGAPDFPFCLCWANETWSGVWHGAPHRVLIEQTYPGRADHEAHFRVLLPAFSDSRYMRVEGKPLFLIHRPAHLPDAAATLDLWRAMAADAGLGGLHIAGISFSPDSNLTTHGFDAEVAQPGFAFRQPVLEGRPSDQRLAPRPRHPQADATAQVEFSQLLDCNESESGRRNHAVCESRYGKWDL